MSTKFNIKTYKIMIFGCLIYFISYITRLNYQAALSEIITDLNTSKQIASLALTGCFITYGIGQIVSGFLGDKFEPKKLLIMGLFFSSLSNLIVAFSSNIIFITVIWSFNGFFQSMLWPPLVKLLTHYYSGKMYEKATVLVSVASCSATIVVYLNVPLSIYLYSYRLAFLISAVAGFITCILSFFILENIFNKAHKKAEHPAHIKDTITNTHKNGYIISSGFILILIAVMAQGTLKDGIAVWMPTYIKEVFNLNSASSILSGAVLPVFSVFSILVAATIQKKIQNLMMSSVILLGVTFLAALLLIPLFNKSIVACVIILAFMNANIHGVNFLLTTRVPQVYIKTGKVSTITGVLNSATYVGSTISTYGFAILAENYGWLATICAWALMALLGGTLLLINTNRFKKFALVK